MLTFSVVAGRKAEEIGIYYYYSIIYFLLLNIRGIGAWNTYEILWQILTYMELKMLGKGSIIDKNYTAV